MDSTQSEREAADWLAQRDSGRWTPSDEATFAEWQSQSTANRVAAIRLKTAWRAADRLQALGAGVQVGQVPPPNAWRLSPFFDDPKQSSCDTASLPITRRRVSKLYGLAASVLLVLIGGAFGYWALRNSNAYHTSIGGLRSVTIADGSTVTLNTSTAIRLAVTAREREVVLDQGEAFFEVAHDPNRPFVVRAGNQRIVAVGTKFSVFREFQGTRVVVTEGQVRVEEGGVSAPVTSVPAGSIARAGAAGVLVKKASLTEAQAYLAWRSGYIALHDTPLADAVAEFNRYNKKQLVIGDSSIADIRIGGNLRATNLTAFAHVLEQEFPVRATDEGDEIVLTAR